MTTIRTVLKIRTFESIDIETLNVFAALSVAVLTVVYFFMASSLTIVNYRKAALQKNIGEIRMEIRNLNLELSEKRSIGFLEKAAAQLGLVESDKVQYVKMGRSVAKNQ